MPSEVPRSDTSKKREQLFKRQEELVHGIRSGFPPHKLAKAAERVRAAQLSLLKARLHWIEDAKVQRTGGRPFTRATGDVQQIHDATREWTEKTIRAIIADHARDLTNQ